MRPRVFPAEDAPVFRVDIPDPTASMRPRVFPAEDVVDGDFIEVQRRASMRPRVFPAEDRDDGPRRGSGSVRFNEAGYSPRKTDRTRCGSRRRSRFNEAAGIPRGRLL